MFQTEFTIAEIAANEKNALNGGPFGSKLVSSMYAEKGVPVIRGNNLPFDKKFHDGDFVYVTKEKAKELRAHIARQGDVIFTQRGTLGQIGIIPNYSIYDEYVVSQSQMKLTVNSEIADYLYIYYAFRSPVIMGNLISCASSSGVPHINLQTLRDFRLHLPQISIQRKVASILTAYDDLIENNTRRIAILEEMARRLFEEWFVLYRYPGAGDAPVDDQLPDGWVREPISRLYQGLFDGPHATPAPAENGPIFLGIGNVTEAGHLDLSKIRHIAEEDFPKWTKRVTPAEGDIVFTYEATLNRYALIPPGFNGCLGRRMALIRTAPEHRINLFLYYYFFSQQWRDVVQANILSGATVDRIPLTSFPSFPVNRPPDGLIHQFDDLVRPMVQQTQNLQQQNTRLRAARDLLLPKLISGEIDVSRAPLPLEIAAE